MEMWCRCCSVPARSTWQPAHGWRGGSSLITTFTSPKNSAGTMTAQSMWVSCNQYMGVLDSPYSADAIHIVTRKRARQEGDLQMQWKTNIPDIHSYAHNEASALVFSRGTQVQQEWKKIHKLSAPCLHLVPQSEGAPRGEAGVMVKH